MSDAYIFGKSKVKRKHAQPKRGSISHSQTLFIFGKNTHPTPVITSLISLSPSLPPSPPSTTTTTVSMSSLFLRPFLHPLPAKPTSCHQKTTILPPQCLHPSLRCYSQNKTSTTTNLSKKDYRSSWEQELKTAFPTELEHSESDDDDEDGKFQELIDKRCVDNMRMLMVDAVQNSKAGHPGMALGMAEVGYYL